jgi:hypothetical protein
VTAEEECRIAQAIAEGRLVKAIRLVRSATGASLADAKLYVTALADKMSRERSPRERAELLASDRKRLDSSLARFTFVLTFVLTIVIILASFAGAVALLTNSALFPA